MIIFFDLDGTLIDITNRFYKVYSDIMDELGKTKLSYIDYINLRRKHVSTRMILKTTNSDELYDEFIKKRNEILERPEYLKMDALYPDSYGTLERLYGNNVLILVTLRMNKANTLQQLRNLGIHKFFEGILIGDMFGGWKEKYNLMKKFKKISEKKNMIIVGDTEIDVKAGKKLGIKTCFKKGGMRKPEIVIKEKPDYIIDTTSQIIEIIKKR